MRSTKVHPFGIAKPAASAEAGRLRTADFAFALDFAEAFDLPEAFDFAAAFDLALDFAEAFDLALDFALLPRFDLPSAFALGSGFPSGPKLALLDSRLNRLMERRGRRLGTRFPFYFSFQQLSHTRQCSKAASDNLAGDKLCQ